MKQKIIVSKADHFQGKINHLLKDGEWRVVPGSIGGYSFRRLVSDFDDGYQLRGNETFKKGETFTQTMWCVLERIEDEHTASY